MKIPKKTMFASIVAISALVVAVYAFTSFTQTFPSVTVPPPPNLVGFCNTPSQNGAVLAAVDSPTSQSGSLMFACKDTNGNFAPTIAAFNGPVTATPTFTLPSGYTGLGYVLGTNPLSSSQCSGATPITSGTAISIQNGGYEYCANFNLPNGGTLSSFTITWS